MLSRLCHCRKLRRVNYLATITLNLLLTLCASNLMFILGVQASKNIFKCEMIAVLLHYFHLSTAVWGLCHTFAIYDFVIHDNAPVIKYNNLFAYGGSGVFVLVSPFRIQSKAPMLRVLFSGSFRLPYLAQVTRFTNTAGCLCSMEWLSILWFRHRCWLWPPPFLVRSHCAPWYRSSAKSLSRALKIFWRNVNTSMRPWPAPIFWRPKIIYTLILCQMWSAVKKWKRFVRRKETSSTSRVRQKYSYFFFSLFQVCENDLKSIDFYDSKFDLGALSIADLSLQSSSDVQDFAEFKRAIKFSLFFQPAFTVCWFLGVVALENRQSCVMPIIFIVCYNLLVWTMGSRFSGSRHLTRIVILIHAFAYTLIKALACTHWGGASTQNYSNPHPSSYILLSVSFIDRIGTSCIASRILAR